LTAAAADAVTNPEYLEPKWGSRHAVRLREKQVNNEMITANDIYPFTFSSSLRSTRKRFPEDDTNAS
jgi:hypothetical protein